MKQYHIIITGKVQGVFFRQSARAMAERLGILGFARNTATGGVEIVARGDLAALGAFIEWCKNGPPGAGVSGLKTEEQPADDSLSSFEIRY